MVPVSGACVMGISLFSCNIIASQNCIELSVV